MKANRWALISAGSIRDSSHEELQTDVMSFMAILGFCMMAIFAIVQSIPLAPVDNRPQLETVLTLQKDIQHLSKRLLELQQQSNLEAQRIQQMQLEAKQHLQLQLKLQDSVTEEFTRLQATKDYLVDVNQRIEKQSQRLHQINSDLWEGKQTLSSLRRRVRIETRILNEQQDELQALEFKLAELSAVPKPIQKTEIAEQSPEPELPVIGNAVIKPAADSQAKMPPASKPKALPPSLPTPLPQSKAPEQQTVDTQAATATPQHIAKAATTPPKNQQQGFSLRFDSDGALLKLLRQDRVQLFAMTRRQAWQLKSAQQRYQLNDSPKPKSFYEMANTTVPKELVRELQLQRSIYNPDDLTWGVVLPPDVRSQISQLMNNYSHGTLVITNQAQVQREGS
ncbi:MAG: hypothetical protein V7739_08650 [Motiliproteus sp.]